MLDVGVAPTKKVSIMCQRASKATDPSTQPARTETGDLKLHPAINREAAIFIAALAGFTRDKSLTPVEADKLVRRAIFELQLRNKPAYENKPVVVAAKLAVDIAEKLLAQDQAKIAAHGKDEKTLVVENTHNIKIKPFATLEDIVTSGHKFADILFPDHAQDPRDYELSVINSAAALATVDPEDKFEALTSLLGLVLMGYEPDQLGAAKDLLRVGLEEAIHIKVKEATVQALGDLGLKAA